MMMLSYHLMAMRPYRSQVRLQRCTLMHDAVCNDVAVVVLEMMASTLTTSVTNSHVLHSFFHPLSTVLDGCTASRCS